MSPITGASDRAVYIGGKFVPESEATVSVFDHVVLYGDAVFDTCCAWGGKVFKLGEHIDRFFESAHALKLEIPSSKEALTNVVLELIRRNRLQNAYIKMIATRGVGDMPLMHPYGCQPNLIVFAVPYLSILGGDKGAKGIRAKIVSVRRIPSECLDAKIKSCNYLNHILARMEARESGFDEAIEMSVDGYVAEAPGYNVFIVKGGMLYTPDEDILVGVTRQTVIELAGEAGMATVARQLSAFDLYNADEVFLCSTAGGIFAVVDVDGRRIGSGKPGPVTARLQELYLALLESGRQSTPAYVQKKLP
jgi:branched-chain amino acid aminotransferase